MEQKTLEELKADFAAKISAYKDSVMQEFQKRNEGYKEPEVVEGLSDDYVKTAERFIELQKLNGSFSKKDLSESDFIKITTIAKKFGISNKEAVAHFITNDRYMSPEAIETENLCNLIEDIFEVYNEHYETLGAFPINALSQSSRDYMSNKKIALGLKDKLQVVLEEYIPELAGMEIALKSYKAVPRYRFDYNDQIARQVAKELKETFADENGYVDSLFAEKNSEDLTKLLKMLSERKISFEQFASKNGIKYTRCYSLSSVPATIFMVENYEIKNGTFRGITNNDPYLRLKIDVAEKHDGTYDLRALVEKSSSAKNDVFDNGQKMTKSDIIGRETSLIYILNQICPDGIVDSEVFKTHPKLYNECLNLAARRGCASIDEYLAGHKFVRKKLQVPRTREKVIILTERDLDYYGFTKGEKSVVEQNIRDFNIVHAPVENNRAVYENLVANHQDSSRYKRPSYENAKIKG